MNARRLVCCLTLLGCLVVGTGVKAADDTGWIRLFDGKSLEGWVQRGGKARYRVEDGMIIGTCVTNTPNSFLCTRRDFTNFVLELEYKIDKGLNRLRKL